MVILGIDPGSRRIGYGVIEQRSGGVSLLDAGLLRLTAQSETDSLGEVRAEMNRLIRQYCPSILALEKLYLAKNRATAMRAAEARGVVVLAAVENGLELKEFTPNEVKADITGYGLADKRAVAKMVRFILKRPDLRIIDDASDALAIGIVACRRACF